MKSLRGAILFWMAVLLFVVGAVSATVTFEYVKIEMQTSFDSEVRQIAHFLQSEAADSLPSHDALAIPDPGNLFLIQVWDAQGELIRSTDRTISAQAPQATGFSTEALGITEWRSYNLVGLKRSIRVSLPLDERNEQATAAALQIAIPLAVMIPLSWLLLSMLMGRILAGLDAAALQVKNRKAGNTTQISTQGVPHEIVPFVEELNHHVAQVQAQGEKQKQFLADAAHELRTPLTALSIQLNNLMTVLDTKDQRQRLAAAVGGSKRANQLVSRLLQLARNDSAASPMDGETELLSKLLQEAAARLQAQAADAEVRILSPQPGEQDLLLPKQDFSQICEILLDNAICHGPTQGEIVLSASVAAGSFTVKIIDQGPGIATEKLPFVFDRFYRAEPHQTQGTGLGLSIAKAVCARRGWSIRLENRKSRSGLKAIISGKVGTF